MKIIKKFKKRRGSFDVSAMIFYLMTTLFILVLIMFTFLYIIGGFKINITYTARGMESSLLTHRILYSPNCFAYYDNHLLRTYPGVIDINKFTQENFNNCLDSDKIVSLTLKDEHGNEIKTLTNSNSNIAEIGGEKPVFVYDKGLKVMLLEIKIKELK